MQLLTCLGITTWLKNKPKDFSLLSGDDASGFTFSIFGWNGVISVTANVVPGYFSKMCKFILEKKYEDVLRSMRNYPLNNLLLLRQIQYLLNGYYPK